MSKRHQPLKRSLRKAAAEAVEVMNINRAGIRIVLGTFYYLLLEACTGQLVEPICIERDDHDSFQRLSNRLWPITRHLPISKKWNCAQCWLAIAKRRFKKAGIDGLFAALEAAADGTIPDKRSLAVYRILFDPTDPTLQRAISRADAAYEALDEESRIAEDLGIPEAIENTLNDFLFENDLDHIDVELTPIGDRKIRIDRINNTGGRGRGHASMLLRALCDACDRQRIMLTASIAVEKTEATEPSTTLHLDNNALIAWFGRYGFRQLKTKDRGRPVMTRRPEAKQPAPRPTELSSSTHDHAPSSPA